MIQHLKHSFTIFILLFSFTSTLFSQISITRDDMPSPGDVLNYSIADTLLEISAGEGGPNLNWDYSTLDPIAQQRDSFLTVPFAYRLLFGGADVARYIPVPDSIGNIAVDLSYQFFNKSSSKYENLGSGFEISQSPIPLALRNDPSDVVYNFPLTFGDIDSSNSVATLDLSAFGIFYRTQQKRTNEVDAWGNLTTPYGNFDAIRVKTQIIARDSIQFDTIGFATNRPLQTNYKWLAKGEEIPVLSMNYFRIGGDDRLISVTYRDSIRNLNPPTNINRPVKSSSLKMYPNPATDQVRLELKSRLGKNASIEILDLQGRKVRFLPVDENSFSMSVSGLPRGTYIVRLQSEEGIYNGKLVVE